jgi:antitoxin (DNA-binding transcriptional repressor) of toxin-antitoxin stability system
MARAAAGEEFYVTRWGNPYVRLCPASTRMPLGKGKARSGGSAGP